MSTINLTFLGREYILPGDILTYMEYQQFFSLLRQKLLSFMLEKFSDCEKWPSLDLATNKFRDTAEQYVKWLCEQGIYDKTADDFMDGNPGYELYEQAVKETLLKKADILMAYIKNLQADMVTAEQAAASNITGMGFTVYSSSIIDLGVFAAMEHNTLKKQAAAADAQYNAMVEDARRRGQSSSNKQTAKLNAEYWLPKMNEAVTVFVASLFNMFIDYLIAAHKFDATARNYLDIKRAEMIVKNISAAADKEQLIREAFLKCPFCLSVYKEVVRLGALTTNECQSAKVFGLLDDIEADNRANAKRIALVMEKPESCIVSELSHYAYIAAIIHNTTTEAVIEDFLSIRRRSNIDKLENLQRMGAQSLKFDQLMRAAVAEKVSDIINIAENGQQLETKFYHYINTIVLMNDDSNFYDSHKQKAVVALIAKADEYLHEAFCRYSEYKKCESSYLRIHKKTEEQIAALNAERQKLSFWRFARREDIDAEIQHLQKKEEEAKQAMRRARKHFEKMYR